MAWTCGENQRGSQRGYTCQKQGEEETRLEMEGFAFLIPEQAGGYVSEVWNKKGRLNWRRKVLHIWGLN